MVGILEAISWLALVFTMYLKYWLQMPEPNKIVGMIHGVFFLGYCLLAWQVKIEYQWKWSRLVALVLASLFPFGTLLAEVRILKKINPEQR